MERALTSEERIRRAEEIYARRRQVNGVRVATNTANNRKEYGLLKKVILQVTICLLIYFIFYLIKNSNYIFSEEVLKGTRNFLSYDINFEKIYTDIEDFYNNNIKNFFLVQNDTNTNETNTDETKNEKVENTVSNISENKEEMGIGGGEDNLSENEQVANETSADEIEPKELSQMEIDAKEIKENYNLIVPLKGVISSRFGPRIPTDIVSSNHAGIDIAANEGTIFYSSMDGVVTYVSSEGGYGNHFWIQKDDVITLYAHCSNIYVKEGDVISQGDEIGEVGQTGNATGPHLHFEIRKDNRAVDPELILDF